MAVLVKYSAKLKDSCEQENYEMLFHDQSVNKLSVETACDLVKRTYLTMDSHQVPIQLDSIKINSLTSHVYK